MIIQQEILRLKELGHSQRKIAKILGISRNTVIRYFNGPPEVPDPLIPLWAKELDWEQIHKDAKKTPKKILYEELSEVYSLPSYQAFCQYMRNHPVEVDLSSEVSIRIYRPPGESMEVDYSGDSVEILNPATGEIYRVELFVGALSYSSDFYAEFTLTQQLEDFITSHNNMFHYFGGVARYIVPDNCKTAVLKTDKYDPITNKTYNDMCAHYGIAIDPADRYSPTHKPVVEKSVHIIQQDFLPRIRNKTFTSLYELNRELHNWLAKKRNEVMKDRGNSRKFFFEKEKPLLRELPADQYELFYFKKVKLHPDCHFRLNHNFYSAPYRFVGKELDIKFNGKLVHAFYNTELIATHAIKRGNFKYSTHDQHYPEKKFIELNYHLQKARKESKEVGPNMEALIETLIKQPRFPLKNLRKIQGILKLKQSFDCKALEEAADLALEFNKLNYNSIKNFAKHYKPNKPQESAPVRVPELTCLQGGANE